MGCLAHSHADPVPVVPALAPQLQVGVVVTSPCSFSTENPQPPILPGKRPGPGPVPCARTFATHFKNMFLSATALVPGVNTTLLIVNGPECSMEWMSPALPHHFLFPGCPITSLFSSQKGHVCSLFILNTSMTPALLSGLPTALAECSDQG